ncbi:hypothetical protein M3P05_16445 [Sansalvadorimonas sp. 2012CJ34-2]|uniref:Uncharacterized protein n=1 Tax=Parendozoicomonas callyspongiae TaxID=2942213 RepID=A0ABT0PJJ8_9GAMM|nr:hypothetical protein [Sansalvadorimonas sp. 2012CJ34-2]MCL6271508.1 hypothetical protein [Sansalvadorimonas sp. 2012CJ34-2]
MPSSLPPDYRSGVNGGSYARPPVETHQRQNSKGVHSEELLDRKIPSPERQISELPDEDDEVFHSLRPAQTLLNKDQSGRVVSRQSSVLSDSDDEEFFEPEEYLDSEYLDAPENLYEPQGSLSLNDREITETIPESKGWFSWLNPFSGRKKSTTERSISKSQADAEVETINHDIWELIKTQVIDKYVQGLKSWEIPNLLQTMSTVYHRWKNRDITGEGVAPETVHLSALTIPNALGEGRDLYLTNVTIKIRKIRPHGPGEGYDKFRKLRVLVDISGDAQMSTGYSKFAGDVAFKDVIMDMNFREGAVIGKLMESGTLTGTTPRAIWQLFDANFFSNIKNYALGKLFRSSTPTPGFWKVVQDYLFTNILPHDIKIKPAHCNIHFTGVSADNADCSVDVGFDELELALDKRLPDSSEAHQATLKNVRLKGKGQHILHFLPEDIHEQAEKYLPYAKHSETVAEVELDQLSVLYSGASIRAACPNIKVKTQGDVDLTQGHIKNFAAVVQSTPKSHIPEVVVGFDEAGADAHVPLSTFQLPYEVKGPVRCEKAAIKFSPTSKEDGSHKGIKITAQAQEIDAAVDGGIEFNGTASNISVGYDTHETKLDLEVKKASAQHFNVATGGSQITPENQLVKGHGDFHGIKLKVEPEQGPLPEDQKRSMVTKVEVARAKTRDLEGKVSARLANLSKVEVTQKFTGEMKQQIDVTANTIDSTQVLVPDQALAGYAEVDLDTARVNKVSATCEVLSAPLTETEKEEAHKKIPVPSETWKIPQTAVVSTNVDMTVQSTSGDISAAIPLPQKQEEDEEVDPKPTPRAYTAGSFEVRVPKLTVEYDANNGVEAAILQTDTARLELDHGAVRGEVSAHKVQTEYVQHSQDDPDTATVHATVVEASGKGLTVDNNLKPEGVEVTADFNADHPEAWVQLRKNSETESTQTKTKLEMENGSIKTELAISRSQIMPGSTKDKVQKLRAMLPAEYAEKLEAPLHYLETIPEEPNEELEKSILHQTVEVAAHKLHADLSTGERNTLDLNTHSADIKVTEGTVQAHAQLNDIEAHIVQDEDTINTGLHVDEIVTDKLSTKGNVNISLSRPAVITGAHFAFHQGLKETKLHTEIENVDIDMNAGVNGLAQAGTAEERPLAPAHIQVNGQHLEVDVGKNIVGTVAAAQIQKLHFELDDTVDQLGVDIKLKADLSDGLLGISSTEDQLRVDASAEKVHVKTEKDLNGVMDIHGAGITVLQDEDGIKINTRIDSKKTKFDFADPARELVQIFTRERLAQSPLGKACELSVTPNLDNTLTGTVSGSARGVLSPLIGLLLTVATSRKTRALLHIAEFLSGTMKFGVQMKNLPVLEGSIKVSDIFKCTSIQIFSERGFHGKVYSGIISFLANYLAPWIMKPIMAAMNLTNKTAGEISLSTLASYTGQNIQFVSHEDLPMPPGVSTSRLLQDAHKWLLINRKLPEWWDDRAYIDGLEQKLVHMRWNNKALGKNREISERDIRELCKAIAKDFPLPTTAGEFRRVTEILDLLQTQLRLEKEKISLRDAYNQAHDHMAKIKEAKYNGTPLGSRSSPIARTRRG